MVSYSVDATLVISTGPDTEAVVAAAKEALETYNTSVQTIETDFFIAGRCAGTGSEPDAAAW